MSLHCVCNFLIDSLVVALCLVFCCTSISMWWSCLRCWWIYVHPTSSQFIATLRSSSPSQKWDRNCYNNLIHVANNRKLGITLAGIVATEKIIAGQRRGDLANYCLARREVLYSTIYKTHVVGVALIWSAVLVEYSILGTSQSRAVILRFEITLKLKSKCITFFTSNSQTYKTGAIETGCFFLSCVRRNQKTCFEKIDFKVHNGKNTVISHLKHHNYYCSACRKSN